MACRFALRPGRFVNNLRYHTKDMHVFVLIADLSVLCPLGLPYASLAVRQLALGMSTCGQACVSVCVCVFSRTCFYGCLWVVIGIACV